MSLPIPQIFSDHYPPSECFAFDIAVNTSATNGKGFCPYYLPLINYLNQEALGVPLNFTYISESVLRSIPSAKEVSLRRVPATPSGRARATLTARGAGDLHGSRCFPGDFALGSNIHAGGRAEWCRQRVGRRVRETGLCQRWPTWATTHPFKS
jgi:hypothetical protein